MRLRHGNSPVTTLYCPAVSRGEIRSEESQVIFDSSYFKNIDGVEASIEKDSRLQDIDLRVKEEYLETLTKFYQVQISYSGLMFIAMTEF